ncbi:MAG: hypothetical protein QOE55_5218 [Acidobacteriaceae bacterium]|jgi:hypothetical protein|nr:hypothetical protein [Acidobacteriaceae bacterium]
MWTQQSQTIGTASNIVAALFFDDVSARDAVADLKIAGFRARDIGVALSEEGKRARNRSSDAKHFSAGTIPEGEHSLFWKFRHSLEHDLHSQEPNLSSREDAAPAGAEKPAFRQVDLTDTLLAFGVADVTIRLLDREMGASGLLILVDAGDRADEAESIFEQDRGFLRTVMATERSGVAG